MDKILVAALAVLFIGCEEGRYYNYSHKDRETSAYEAMSKIKCLLDSDLDSESKSTQIKRWVDELDKIARSTSDRVWLRSFNKYRSDFEKRIEGLKNK